MAKRQRQTTTNCFITGGSRGIGRAIVLRFVEAGYRCAFTYRERKDEADRTVALAKELNPAVQVSCYQMELKDSDQVEQVCRQVIDEFDHQVDVVVNNAALIRANYAAMMSNEEWEDVIRVCLSGPFYVIRSFLLPMIGQRYGRIINISSMAQDGSSGQANYSAAKAGLCALTKTIAKEYGARGITCNAVAPGLLETDMTADHLPAALRELMLKYCPLQRACTPEELSAAVYFLTLKDSGYINGAILPVNGGLDYTV